MGILFYILLIVIDLIVIVSAFSYSLILGALILIAQRLYFEYLRYIDKKDAQARLKM